MGADVVQGDDLVASSERTCIWMYDATEVLRRFARLCALDVIDLWDAPDVVVRYLRTGDESLRDAARAACAAAGDAAGDSARDACAAAGNAAWDAARAAAWDAAWDARAARAAAWDAAWDAQNRRLHRMLMKGRHHGQ